MAFETDPINPDAFVVDFDPYEDFYTPLGTRDEAIALADEIIERGQFPNEDLFELAASAICLLNLEKEDHEAFEAGYVDYDATAWSTEDPYFDFPARSEDAPFGFHEEWLGSLFWNLPDEDGPREETVTFQLDHDETDETIEHTIVILTRNEDESVDMYKDEFTSGPGTEGTERPIPREIYEMPLETRRYFAESLRDYLKFLPIPQTED